MFSTLIHFDSDLYPPDYERKVKKFVEYLVQITWYEVFWRFLMLKFVQMIFRQFS